jgi:hypothetical protein
MFNDGDLPGWSFDTSTSDLSPIAARPQLPPSWTPSAVPRQVLAACCFLKEEKRFDPQTQKSLRLGTGSMFDDVVPHLDGSFNI